MIVKEITITVLPRSSRNQVVEESENYIKIKLTAAPTDGKANQALVKFLAKKFDVSKSQIEIIKGLTSPKKFVRIYK